MAGVHLQWWQWLLGAVEFVAAWYSTQKVGSRPPKPVTPAAHPRSPTGAQCSCSVCVGERKRHEIERREAGKPPPPPPPPRGRGSATRKVDEPRCPRCLVPTVVRGLCSRCREQDRVLREQEVRESPAQRHVLITYVVSTPAVYAKES